MNILRLPHFQRVRRGATRRTGSTHGRVRWLVLGLAGVTALALGLAPEPESPIDNAESLSGTTPASPTAEASAVAGDTAATVMEAVVRDPGSQGTTSASPELVDAALPAAEPLWVEEQVRSGDNLSLIFARAGFSDRDVYEVTQADGGRALRKIFPGETIAFQTDSDGQLIAVRHTESLLKSTVFERAEAGFRTQIIERDPVVRLEEAALVIDSSLFLAGQQAGLSVATIMQLANIYGGVIDFALDPRQGDRIYVLHEQLYLDGERVGDGAVVAASFTNRGETFEAYRYTDSEGDTSYYNELGVSMQKAFLKAPLDFRRVSSNFNPKRLHPIHKTVRPHRGTDYAADRGTPVYAAGDGKVIEAGYTRANGNYVFIQHGEQYRTHYLHLHKLRTKRGARVKQGEVIGTVGDTGTATAPHLHYEFLVNGVHRNPRTVHKLLPKARSLPETELANFRQAIQSPLQQLAALRGETRLAMAE